MKFHAGYAAAVHFKDGEAVSGVVEAFSAERNEAELREYKAT